MDWRILTAITVLAWDGYNVMLKAAAGRLVWQVSILWFVIGYAALVAGYCLLCDYGAVRNRILMVSAFWPLAAGVLCGVGAITFFKALPLASGSVLLPLVGLYVLVSAIGCLIFLHEPFSLRVAAGIVCAVAAVVLLGR